MKMTFLGQPEQLSESSFPFWVTYISIATGQVVERFRVEYAPVVVLPRIDRQHGNVRTRIEWPDGRVQETDPPGTRTLPKHDDRMLTFPNLHMATLAFSFSYMRQFWLPFGCTECERWHVYLLQVMPATTQQDVVAVNPLPSQGPTLEQVTVGPEKVQP